MDPAIPPKHLLTGPDGLLRVGDERALLGVALGEEREPAIAMVAAVGGQLGDLSVVVAVEGAQAGGQGVAHDEQLGVGGEAQVGDGGVEGEAVAVALVEDEGAEGERGGLEGGLGVARRRVEGRARARPAGVRPRRPLQVLEGDAERQAAGARRAVVEDLLRRRGVGGQGRVGAAE